MSVNENVDVGMAVDYVVVGCSNVGICADVAVGMLVVKWDYDYGMTLVPEYCLQTG